MTVPLLQPLLRAARRDAGTPADAPSDGELLDRFVTRQDEAAFGELLRRHGPWLLGLGRRLLSDVHAAEDVFQATFLVLVRKAGSVRRRASVGSWLHGVALRVAARARSRAIRWHTLDEEPPLSPAADPADEAATREAVRLLHAEIAHLPERYREPILLCDLACLSREEAARRLGCSEGSVKGRLERGRAILRERLVRRGLTLSVGVVAVSQVTVPTALSAALLQSADSLVLGLGTEAIAHVIATLMEGAMRMSWTKAWTVSAAVALFGMTAVGIGWSAVGGPPAKPMKPAVPPVMVALPLIPAAPTPAPNNKTARAALREAEQALENVAGTPMERARLWFEIARLHGRLGDRPAAEAALGKAREIVDTMGDQKYGEWGGLGDGYARLGDVRRVLDLAAAVPGPAVPGFRGTADEFRRSILQAAAFAAAQAGRIETGLEIAKAIRDAEYRTWVEGYVRCRAVLNSAMAGDMAGARKAVKELPTALMKVQALVGTVYLNRVYADMLDGETGLALIRLDAGDRDGARQNIRQALALIPDVPEKSRAQVVTTAVRALAKLGDIDAAQKELPKIDNPALRLKADVYIAMAQVRVGQGHQALALVDGLKTDEDRVYALHQIGFAQARAGDKDGARESFRRALELAIAGKINGHNLVSAQAAAGDSAGAIAAAEKLNFTMWSNIAYFQAKAGDFAGAIETALERERSDWWRAVILRIIAREQTRAGQEGGVRVWIARAEDALNKAYALFGLAEGLYREDGRARKPADP
jgi:RNA polymerase sigma factor (sigma-70 family)